MPYSLLMCKLPPHKSIHIRTILQVIVYFFLLAVYNTFLKESDYREFLKNDNTKCSSILVLKVHRKAYICTVLVALFFINKKGLKKGIRLKSGAVPAAVNLFFFFGICHCYAHGRDGKARRIGEPEDLPELILLNLIFGEKRSLERLFFQFIFSEAIICQYMKSKIICVPDRRIGFLFLLIFLLGSSYSFAQSPKRIISLAPSLTKNLYLLDAEDLLVGCTNYCHLQSETDAEVVASAIQVNYEKAVMLKPDLVITTDLTKSKTIDTFKKLDVDVLVFPNPTSFSEICEQFIQLGEKVGKKELAEQIIEDAKKRIELIKQKVPENASKQKIFMQIGANPLFAVVPETFMNDFIEFSGTENIFSDLTMGSVNRETILVRNPDIIVVVLMGTMGAEEKNRWEQFENLSAVRKKQVFTMDADNACSPTPLSFVDALDELIGLIYKE